MILGVNKYERFIAAKLLLESFLASGIGLDKPEVMGPEVTEIGEKLHKGLSKHLKTTYGCRLINNKWVPKPLEECI